MIFKKIEMAGFKSFADHREIPFDDGVTAIVGPNGCGKSNVADSIRWVLGEQSSKLLRGQNMQDVIFKGTEKRKSLSYCEVSLYFDNSQRTFNINYDEVVLTRKLYRSGTSEYLINKNPVRLKDIVDLQTVYQAAKVSKERLLSLINVKSGEDEGIEICKFNNIRTKNIGFGYNSYSRVLEGCSIEINEGDKLFIKGASGTGKTTFAKILCGLYEPCEGEILLNDVLYKKISSRCIHQMIYYVSDDEYLFSGTIASNIFASNDADVDSLNMLISRLKLDALISRLPHGINSVVTENGKNYSKGERQKIAMARALYAKPEVLIMDEALEGVDSEDSTDIMNFLLNISDLTLVMISHNDSFSQRFDKQININSMGKWLISRN